MISDELASRWNVVDGAKDYRSQRDGRSRITPDQLNRVSDSRSEGRRGRWAS